MLFKIKTHPERIDVAKPDFACVEVTTELAVKWLALNRGNRQFAGRWSNISSGKLLRENGRTIIPSR